MDVEVIRFDDYVDRNAVDPDRVGLIKIDVEGYESAVFDGMERLLNKPGRKVPILCEILTDLQRPHQLDGRRVVRRLEGYGYRCLDAASLKPFSSSALRFEENILCI